MDKGIARRLLAELAAHGVPPRDIGFAGEALPVFSVGLDAWVDRLARTYFREFSRSDAHFKLVLAPYGGGKTHFLMTLAVRALEERFAVAYVQCVPDKVGAPVRVDNPLGLYADAVGRLRIPDRAAQGMPALLEAVVEFKRGEIKEAGAPDPDSAFNLYLKTLRQQTFPSGLYGDFALVLSHALRGYWEGDELSAPCSAAQKWLEGRMDSITPEEWKLLGLRRVNSKHAGDLGRKLLLALAKVSREAGCHGLALLVDEVETLFTSKGKALQAVLGAMRVMVDWAGASHVEVPLFCAFAATPDVLAGITKYPALQQRLAEAGATFDEGHDFSPQISLDRIGIGHEPLLRAIGERLVDVALAGADDKLSRLVQVGNAERLAQVASRQSLDINARRLYVKTWAGLLNLQMSQGERTFSEGELVDRYRGAFDDIRAEEQEAFEP